MEYQIKNQLAPTVHQPKRQELNFNTALFINIWDKRNVIFNLMMIPRVISSAAQQKRRTEQSHYHLCVNTPFFLNVLHSYGLA